MDIFSFVIGVLACLSALFLILLIYAMYIQKRR